MEKCFIELRAWLIGRQVAWRKMEIYYKRNYQLGPPQETENIPGGSTEGCFVEGLFTGLGDLWERSRHPKAAAVGNPGPEEKQGPREIWSQAEDLSVAGGVAYKDFTPWLRPWSRTGTERLPSPCTPRCSGASNWPNPNRSQLKGSSQEHREEQGGRGTELGAKWRMTSSLPGAMFCSLKGDNIWGQFWHWL